MHSNLSLDQAPSIFTPLRFFISAPLFLLATGVILLIAGPEIFSNRWMPATLAVTHLVTLGFISMCMIGALFQILPVVTGCSIPRPERISLLIYSLYTPGVISLVTGFMLSSPFAFRLALALLGLSLGLFLLVTLYSLLKNPAASVQAPYRGIRISLTGLAIAFIIGITLLAGHGFDSINLLRQHTDIHIAFAAIGWVTITIIAVSFQVIPMFQVTSEFPQPVRRYLVRSVIFSLLAYSLLSYLESNSTTSLKLLQLLTILLTATLIIIYTLSALKLILQRKKVMPDISIWFWITGLACMTLSVVIFFTDRFTTLNLELLTGILFFYGSIVAIITAMLLKIIPFLTWFHLHQRLAGRGKLSGIPVMNQIIHYRQARRLYLLYLLSLVLLVTAFFSHGPLFTLAAIAVIAFSLDLLISMIKAMLIYHRTISPYS